MVFLGTYPPRECGIATFTKDLLTYSQKLLQPYITCKVAALNLSALDSYEYPEEVFCEIDQNNPQQYRELAAKINTDPKVIGVILQHEYGIFGGLDGENILYFVGHLQKPFIVTLHTILPNPNPHFFGVTQKIIAASSHLVVLTHNSKQILLETYPEASAKTSVILHGIHPTQFSSSKNYKKKLKLQNNIILSTFGLLSRGKGIEYVIKSLPNIINVHPHVKYLIIGETHPVVRRQEGEQYRNELLSLVNSLNLDNNVKFYDQYLNLSDLQNYLKATDIYISSSINPNQAVSGTLSYALGAGRAVISTSFPQSREIITPQIGRLVNIQDSAAISRAVLELLQSPIQLEQMNYHAYEVTRPMLWNNIAREYLQLLNIPILPPINLTHFHQMTDNFGMFQFSNLGVPNPDFGYTLDDNARALIIAHELNNPELVSFFLKFIQRCQKEDGSFINYLAYNDKQPSLQNKQEDLEESFARAMWSLSEIIDLSEARQMFLLSYPKLKSLIHLRAIAIAIKAVSNIFTVLPELKTENLTILNNYANMLNKNFTENSKPTWVWFEKHLGYNNAILPEGLLIAGNLLHNSAYLDTGLVSLDFLLNTTIENGMYLPIGHTKWFQTDISRTYYDQQPEDPASTILALATAFQITHGKKYREFMKICFSWFLGYNTLNLPLYNYDTGSCYDGLHPDRINLNQGAESLVSYLLSRIIIEKTLAISPVF